MSTIIGGAPKVFSPELDRPSTNRREFRPGLTMIVVLNCKVSIVNGNGWRIVSRRRSARTRTHACTCGPFIGTRGDQRRGAKQSKRRMNSDYNETQINPRHAESHGRAVALSLHVCRSVGGSSADCTRRYRRHRQAESTRLSQLPDRIFDGRFAILWRYPRVNLNDPSMCSAECHVWLFTRDIL